MKIYPLLMDSKTPTSRFKIYKEARKIGGG
jgi:hypothetical protein